MKIFWYLPIIYTYRLLKLKLKETEDLYVTNTNGKLKLVPLSDEKRENQHVVIHSRKLFFGTTNNLYNLSLDNDSLEIKLKKEKTVVYLKRPKRNGKRSDPFGFKNIKNTKINDESPKDKLKNNRISNLLQDRKNLPNKNFNIEIKRPEIPKKDLNTDEEVLQKNDDEIIDDKTSNIDMNSILTKVKHLLNEKKNYLIESDSKIEEDTVKYTKIDIFIHPIDDKYIKLKTKEKDCVTYFKDSFLFTPCLNVDNQIFRLEKEEELSKKKKIKVQDDEDDTSSTYIPEKKESDYKFNQSKNESDYKFNQSKNESDYKLNQSKNESDYKFNQSKNESDYKLNQSNKDIYNTKDYEEELAYLRNKNRMSKFDSMKLNDSLKSNDMMKNFNTTSFINTERKYSPNLDFESVQKSYDTPVRNYQPNINFDPNFNNNAKITHTVFEQKTPKIENPSQLIHKLKPINNLEPPLKESNITSPTSLLETDSSLSKIMTPDDFLQNIKKSVDIPDFDNLL